MKKQFLFLMMFMLAIFFAATNNSYGQCDPSPLAPAPGVEYTYGVTISGVTAGATYLWYVTEDPNLITGTKINAGTYFTVGSSGSAYNTTTGGTNAIKLTWTSAALGKTLYLVEKTTAQGMSNGVPCEVENMKVYEIKPANTFLLAVTGSDQSGDAGKSEVCVAPIESAIVSGGTVTYLYGQNTLYYKVTASGIMGGWKPSIRLPALAGAGQNYVSAHWAPIGTSTWTSFGVTAGDTDGGDFSSATDATVTDAVNGSSIIIRVVIDNQRYETLANQAITIGVDGHLPTSYTDSDIVGGGNCNPEVAFGKTGTSTITPRPSIAPQLPPPFMSENH